MKLPVIGLHRKHVLGLFLSECLHVGQLFGMLFGLSFIFSPPALIVSYLLTDVNRCNVNSMEVSFFSRARWFFGY